MSWYIQINRHQTIWDSTAVQKYFESFLMEGPSEWRKIAKITIFSLWGNHATTIFRFLAYNPIAHTLEVYIHISTQGLT